MRGVLKLNSSQLLTTLCRTLETYCARVFKGHDQVPPSARQGGRERSVEGTKIQRPVDALRARFSGPQWHAELLGPEAHNFK